MRITTKISPESTGTWRVDMKRGPCLDQACRVIHWGLVIFETFGGDHETMLVMESDTGRSIVALDYHELVQLRDDLSEAIAAKEAETTLSDEERGRLMQLRREEG